MLVYTLDLDQNVGLLFWPQLKLPDPGFRTPALAKAMILTERRGWIGTSDEELEEERRAANRVKAKAAHLASSSPDHRYHP